MATPGSGSTSDASNLFAGDTSAIEGKKTAIVTGAASGIGLGIAHVLLQRARTS